MEAQTQTKSKEKTTGKLTLEEKIILISNEIRVTKDGENTYSNYTYFTPDGILTTLNPLLMKYGIFSHFTLERFDNYYRGILKLSDAQDRNYYIEYSMTSPEIVIKATNPVQSLGGLQTYLKRYLLMNAFHIADNKDDFDANEQHEKKNNIMPKPKAEPEQSQNINNIQPLIDACKDNDELGKLYKGLTPYEQRYWKDKFTSKKADFLNSKIKNNGKD